MVSRTGFTGDLGYELWIDPKAAVRLWDRLFEAGANYGIRPFGTLALTMTRIEAGFIEAGVDFLPADRAIHADRTRSPFELDLGRLVDFSKANFTGRRALLAEQQRGSRYRFVRLDVAGNKPAKDAFIYDAERNNVGVVTSSMWSPAAKASIALASVEMPNGLPTDELYAEIYYQKELKWSRIMSRCRVVANAFFDPVRRRATPALDF
jgi:aminomethyltransferase